MADVRLHNVVKTFGHTNIIQGINLEIKDNEFVVFVGPSGCGKSTLLRLIAGLEDITSGDLLIGGQRVNAMTPAQRGIAMVFQSYALYPHMTNYENMAFALKQAKVAKAEIDAKVRKAADVLQISHLLDRKPKDLSGGQRQRVAIGRAIVRDPKVFLFDEPLSNLDASLRVQMRIEIARLKRELGVTMIYVTHDQVEAMTLADKIVVLRAGRVEQVGSPLELYHAPANQFVAGFIGSPNMNFLSARVEGISGRGVTLRLAGDARATLGGFRLPGNLKPNDALTLGIRPEHLVIVPPETLPGGEFAAVASGQVFVVEHLGGETYIYLRLDAENTLVVRASGDTVARAGDTLSVGIPVSGCHLFGADTVALPRLEQERLTAA